MFFARFSINNQMTVSLYHNWEQFNRDTFSPDTCVHELIEFKTHGKDYQSRKESVRTCAINWSNANTEGLYMSEYAEVTAWFTRTGKRYGLMEEFKENGII